MHGVRGVAAGAARVASRADDDGEGGAAVDPAGRGAASTGAGGHPRGHRGATGVGRAQGVGDAAAGARAARVSQAGVGADEGARPGAGVDRAVAGGAVRCTGERAPGRRAADRPRLRLHGLRRRGARREVGPGAHVRAGGRPDGERGGGALHPHDEGGGDLAARLGHRRAAARGHHGLAGHVQPEALAPVARVEDARGVPRGEAREARPEGGVILDTALNTPDGRGRRCLVFWGTVQSTVTPPRRRRAGRRKGRSSADPRRLRADVPGCRPPRPARWRSAPTPPACRCRR